MANYYEGYSIIMFFVFAMTILILWSVSSFVDTHKNMAVKILYPIAITYLAFGVIEYFYFFHFRGKHKFPGRSFCFYWNKPGQ